MVLYTALQMVYFLPMEFITTLPLLQIHVTAVFITLAIVVIADLHGLLWLMGKVKTLPQKRMVQLHRFTWTGLLTIMTAGIIMFSSYPEYLLSLWAFRFKALFVAALFINAFFIGAHLRVAQEKSFAELSVHEKRRLLFSGAISAICWIGAFLCAQFLS